MLFKGYKQVLFGDTSLLSKYYTNAILLHDMGATVAFQVPPASARLSLLLLCIPLWSAYL
jgi:hypothetical protein